MTKSVLEAPPPRFSADEVATIAAALFGLEGRATDLGSERDQTFLIDDGGAGGVLKISNLGEEPAVLELETEAILHVARVDPELPVAHPRLALSDEYWPRYDGPDGPHYVRLFERLHGRSGGPELDDRALFAYGATHARLNLALHGFFPPAAGRKLLWHLAAAADLRPQVSAIVDPSRRRLVENVLDRYEERVTPRWPMLRAQVVHGDLNLDNVLLDDQGRISGIADFGDIAFGAQVADFAVGVASLLRGRPADDVFRAGRIAIDGYQSRIPLEPLELDVLADLVAARLAAIVTISAWRVERYPENATYIQAWDDDSWKLLELFDATGADEVTRALGGPRRSVPTGELTGRRGEALGPALTDLTYRRPVHVVRGEGVWLFDADGNRLLDAYNNVPVVGHCHPRVTEAVVRLDGGGVQLAATFVDGAFTSDGIRTPAPDEVAVIVEETHAAGGLFVADEVQAGHGRMGDHLWSFVRYGITPDIVTLGKPMGNGYPVAAVITRREIAELLAAKTRVFSTFGGNPVAAQAALAVLDVIEDGRLVENAARVGSRLASSLDALRASAPSIAEVRGRGLLVGVELAMPDGTPDPELAERLVNDLRKEGILIGRTGRHENVLKIRPPLVFADEHADVLVA